MVYEYALYIMFGLNDFGINEIYELTRILECIICGAKSFDIGNIIKCHGYEIIINRDQLDRYPALQIDEEQINENPVYVYHVTLSHHFFELVYTLATNLRGTITELLESKRLPKRLPSYKIIIESRVNYL